jgi:hypothetical protein
LSVKQMAADLGYASLSAFLSRLPTGHRQDADGICRDEIAR